MDSKIQGIVFLLLGILTTLSFLLFSTNNWGPLVIYVTELLLFSTFFMYLAEPTSLKGACCFVASLCWLVDQWQSGLYLILTNIPQFSNTAEQWTVFGILHIPHAFGFTALMFFTVLAFALSIFDLAYELELPVPAEWGFQAGLSMMILYGLIKALVDYQLIGAWDQAYMAMIWALGVLAVALSVLLDHLKATEKSTALDYVIWIGLLLCIASSLLIHGSGLWLLPV